LNYAAPSFNYNKQSGSDGAAHIDLATLYNGDGSITDTGAMFSTEIPFSAKSKTSFYAQGLE
jgi:hypothetical protein